MIVTEAEGAYQLSERSGRSNVARHQLRDPDDGYALVEMLVSLVILSLALGTFFEAISIGLQNTARAERLAKAGMLAQSLLARVGSELPLQPGVTKGRFDATYRWQLLTTSYGDESDRRAWPVAAYLVQADVMWSDGIRERSVTLMTLRLGSKDIP